MWGFLTICMEEEEEEDGDDDGNSSSNLIEYKEVKKLLKVMYYCTIHSRYLYQFTIVFSIPLVIW